MPTIIILQGQAQYEVARHFVASLSAVLSQSDTVNVVELDISRPENAEQALSQLRRQSTDIVFSVNAIGAEFISALPAEARPRFITWLLDHPVYHFGRLMAAKPEVLCVDNSHVGFCQRLGLSATFFPHATEQQMVVPTNLSQKQGILFAASGADETALLNQLSQQAPDIARLLTDSDTTDLIDVMQALQLDKVANNVLQQHSVISLLLLCDNLLRTIKRNRLIKECAEHNIALTIVGNGWQAGRCYDRHSYLPALSFSKLLPLMAQSRFILHHNPGFREGLHERIVYGLQQGTQVLCPQQAFLRAKYGQIGGVKLFDQVQQIKVLSEQAEDDYLSQLQQSQQLTQTCDTWSSRAQTLLNLCFSSEAPENYQSYV